MIKIIQHSMIMVKKTWRMYSFLIITMSLSLSFLLSFLVYTDTKEYNDNKEIFSKSRRIITLSNPDMDKVDKLEEKLNSIEETIYYRYMHQGSEYESSMGTDFEIYFIPSNIQKFYFDDFTCLDLQSDNVRLEKNEVYVSKSLFYRMNEDGEGRKYIDVPIRYKNNLNVVRFYAKTYYNKSKEETDYRERVFISLNDVQIEKLDYENIGVGIFTNKLSEVISLLQTYGLEYNSVYELQEARKRVIREDIYVKAIIVVVLYFLLGVNIYSSFNNTLDKRKFEIGVRRAIGASKREIVIQFFGESMIVMTISALLSILLVGYMSLIYKIIMEKINMVGISIYITKYSVASFMIVNIFMAMCYSLIFSYKATTVQIVSYLKGD